MILQQKRRKRPQPFIIKDKYFHKAKKEGFRARSVFKLEEIQKIFEIIEPQMKVCDIGAAP
jgi:23S rRNA (uridine2552-2'-O)-methyltransferase